MICADKKELELKLPTPINNAKKSTHKIILITSYNPVFAGEVPSSYCSSSPFCDWNPQFKSEVADIPNFIGQIFKVFFMKSIDISFLVGEKTSKTRRTDQFS